MSAQAIYDSAPLGALIKFSDGRPKPPARFTRKVAAWERDNGVGRLIRKTPSHVLGKYTAPACLTLHEADFASGGIVVLTVHRTHNLNSNLSFEIVSAPKTGNCRVLLPFGETVELIHLAQNRTSAEAWLRDHRHPYARVEEVGASVEELAADGKASGTMVSLAQEAL